jgi:transcriptional regulator with XRE-family HTH domain
MPVRVGSTSQRRRHFIQQWRKYRGLSQAELAEKIASSEANLSRLETGKQDYTQGMLEAIAAALETDVASLLTRDPKDGEPIWDIMDRATAAQRRQIVEIAKTITKPEV